MLAAALALLAGLLLALVPVELKLTLRAAPRCARAPGRPQPSVRALVRIEARYLALRVAGAGRAAAWPGAWDARARVRAGLGPLRAGVWSLHRQGPLRLPVPWQRGDTPPGQAAAVPHRARWRMPALAHAAAGGRADALRGALGLLAGRVRMGSVRARARLGLEDAMTTALAVAAVQALLFGALARLGGRAGGQRGWLVRVQPWFGRLALAAHLEVTASVRLAWLLLAALRAAWLLAARLVAAPQQARAQRAAA